MASKAIEEAEETSESVKQKRKNSDSCLDGEIKDDDRIDHIFG